VFVSAETLLDACFVAVIRECLAVAPPSKIVCASAIILSVQVVD